MCSPNPFLLFGGTQLIYISWLLVSVSRMTAFWPMDIHDGVHCQAWPTESSDFHFLHCQLKAEGPTAVSWVLGMGRATTQKGP